VESRWAAGGLGVRDRPDRCHVSKRAGVTLPRHRGHGYGSAVTEAATSWSLENGAKHVISHTDLSNSISNAIYPCIGFRPIYDAAEIAFTPVT
jgi:predicted GNAT family acetyltransferase